MAIFNSFFTTRPGIPGCFASSLDSIMERWYKALRHGLEVLSRAEKTRFNKLKLVKL
jgi:hypothetical protein